MSDIDDNTFAELGMSDASPRLRCRQHTLEPMNQGASTVCRQIQRRIWAWQVVFWELVSMNKHSTLRAVERGLIQ